MLFFTYSAYASRVGKLAGSLQCGSSSRYSSVGVILVENEGNYIILFLKNRVPLKAILAILIIFTSE